MVNNGSMSANASFAAADELQAFANQTCAVSFCWNYSNYTQYAEQTQFTPFAMAFPSDDGKPELEMAAVGPWPGRLCHPSGSWESAGAPFSW